MSDKWPPFNSVDFQKFWQVNGFDCLKSPSYHAQLNGLVECHDELVKNALFKHCMNSCSLTIEQHIVNCLFTLRNTPSLITTSLSPYDMLYRFKHKTSYITIREPHPLRLKPTNTVWSNLSNAILYFFCGSTVTLTPITENLWQHC